LGAIALPEFLAMDFILGNEEQSAVDVGQSGRIRRSSANKDVDQLGIAG
jgi:hypothetical protein